ncbi:MAG TPA: GTPase Era [Chitinophagaceae bacterium]|nr:GTPase Era [Chitinophagaceae bacterium]
MKSGFVNIFGRPNAGKSTLLNALLGEKLAIVSRKVQTTRHRIKGILNSKDYQVVISDTPGIITPEYKLHEKMMAAVKNALEDADIALLLVSIDEDWEYCDTIFSELKLNVPSLVVINKIDLASPAKIREAVDFFSGKTYAKEVLTISAMSGINVKKFLAPILKLLPEGEPFYTGDDISDLPMKFFAGELIREQVYTFFEKEIPYHTAVSVSAYEEKQTLVKIAADIIVQRESQKGILLGENGKMIKKLGTAAREAIEKFIGQKVFLELFVKVRPRWRENEGQLKEYGY